MLTEKDRRWITKMLWMSIMALSMLLASRHEREIGDIRKEFIRAAKIYD